MQLFLIAILLTGVLAQESMEDFLNKIYSDEEEQDRYVIPISTTPPTPKTEQSCGLRKECVRRSLCSPKNKDDSTIIAIRFGLEETKECSSSDQICCSVDDIISKPIVLVLPKDKTDCALGKKCVRRSLCSPKNTDGSTIIEPRFTFEETKECSSADEICCSVEDIITEPIAMPKDKTGCGYRNIDGIGPRFGATNTSEFGEFPWMLAVLRIPMDSDENHLTFFCGASLIHPAVALTAARCVYNKSANTIIVRAGEWELNSETELHPHQDRRVADMVLHKNYNNYNLHYNIALLFMDIPFELTPNVNTACLPPVGFNFNSARCYASGWGTNNFRHGEFSNVLKKVDLPILPRVICQDKLRRTRLGRHFELHWSFLCAGGERGKDTCRGDAGSPLVCPIEKTQDRFYQTGIVAWGIGCFDENVPRVFTNVADLRPWIDNQLVERSINSSYYVDLR